ncbi:MAG: hypothetical protein M4579_004752 [Chaenotheca gracillima]|nr:MAG: hypothetical protein M4579_004752 [Chaenotheca gracillima]
MPTLHARTPSNATKTSQRQAAALEEGGQRHDSQSKGTDIDLFLRNLRLLDLDKREDWPNITAITFSTKDVQQNQRNRIRSVEWALYRLFELWDPEDTRYKLQPFFPPLEPLQSLNLRGALYKFLLELKKTGLLGRDTVLRKSMLDECKGEKFEEILSAFSSAVLRRRLSSKAGHSSRHQMPARARLDALVEDQDESGICALSLAYRSLLTQKLRHREDAEARYSDFLDLLSLKQRQVARRVEQSRAKGSTPKDRLKDLSTQDSEYLKQQLHAQWTGGPKLLELVLSGGGQSRAENLLAQQFNTVWDHLETGIVGDLEDFSDRSLASQLDQTLYEQTHRLGSWTKLQLRLKAENSHAPGTPANGLKGRIQAGGAIFKFDKHVKANSTSASETGTHDSHITSSLAPGPPVNSADSDEYARLMQLMKEEMAAFGKPQTEAHQRRKSLRSRTVHKSAPVWQQSDSKFQRVSTGSSSPVEHSRQEQPSTRPEDIYSYDDRVHAADEPISSKSSAEDEVDPHRSHAFSSSPSPSQAKVHDELHRRHQPDSETTSNQHSGIQKEAKLGARSKGSRLSLLDQDDQDILAEQIVSAATAPGPSPLKARPSLAERTRLSMAFSASFFKENPMSSKSEEPSPAIDPEEDFSNRAGDTRLGGKDSSRTKTLTDRTRRSISSFPKLPAVGSARPQRRTSRSPTKRPAYPTNPFSTPPSASSHHQRVYSPLDENDEDEQRGRDSGVVTPRESLFEQEADYASVFKSRPKIAKSPSLSPTRGDESHLPSFDDLTADVKDKVEYERLAEEWASSPLGRMGRG